MQLSAAFQDNNVESAVTSGYNSVYTFI